MPPDVFQCAHHGKEQPVLAVIFFRFTRYPRFADVVNTRRTNISVLYFVYTFELPENDHNTVQRKLFSVLDITIFRNVLQC